MTQRLWLVELTFCHRIWGFWKLTGLFKPIFEQQTSYIAQMTCWLQPAVTLLLLSYMASVGGWTYSKIFYVYVTVWLVQAAHWNCISLCHAKSLVVQSNNYFNSPIPVSHSHFPFPFLGSCSRPVSCSLLFLLPDLCCKTYVVSTAIMCDPYPVVGVRAG